MSKEVYMSCCGYSFVILHVLYMHVRCTYKLLNRLDVVVYYIEY